MKKEIAIIAVILALVAGISYLAISSVRNNPVETKSTGAFASPLFVPGTATSTVCSASASTMLVASSTGRRYLQIANLSGNAIYLGFGAPAVKYKGFTLMASSTYTFDVGAPYLGALFCIADTSAASTTALDISQLN